MLELNKIYNEDCLEGMKKINDKSIDMILCDLPYGTTACKWDAIIPFDLLWREYKRILKNNGIIALTSSQPFTSALIMSNPKMYRHEWIWSKNKGSNFLNTKREPMKQHESILIFSDGKWTYNPQKIERIDKKRTKYMYKDNKQREFVGDIKQRTSFVDDKKMRCPKSVLDIKVERGLHPTQKPVALFEYLIKTYTNEGELVLDNCIGSGTTAIACINTNRNYIGFENDEKYFNIAKNRIIKHKQVIRDRVFNDVFNIK